MINKILFVSRMPEKGFSGGRYNVILMAQALSKIGYEVTIHANEIPTFYDDLKNSIGDDINWFISPFKNFLKDSFDLVIIIPDFTDEPSLYFAALESARYANAKVMMFCFETPNFMAQTLDNVHDLSRWKYWDIAANFCDGIFCCTKIGADYSQSYFKHSPAKFFHIPPSINDFALKKTSKAPKKRSLVFITRFGAHSEHKGNMDIKFFLNDNWAGYEFDLIRGCDVSQGKDVVDALKQEALAYNITINDLPLISDGEKFEILQRSVATIFTTKFEGFGYPIIESFCANTPTIHYNLSIFHETLPAKKHSCPIGDGKALEALANRVCNGSSYDDNRPQKCDNFEDIKSFYSVGAYGGRIQAIIKDLERNPNSYIDRYAPGVISSRNPLHRRVKDRAKGVIKRVRQYIF